MFIEILGAFQKFIHSNLKKTLYTTQVFFVNSAADMQYEIDILRDFKKFSVMIL